MYSQPRRDGRGVGDDASRQPLWAAKPAQAASGGELRSGRPGEERQR